MDQLLALAVAVPLIVAAGISALAPVHGRGRRLPVTGVVFTLAALGLADLPPFATYLGKGWIEDSGRAHGMAWVAVFLIAASVLVGGAVLRVAGGVFYGLGDPPAEDPEMAREASEERARRTRVSSAPRSR